MARCEISSSRDAVKRTEELTLPAVNSFTDGSSAPRYRYDMVVAAEGERSLQTDRGWGGGVLLQPPSGLARA
jgi:hypothetical protein